MQKLIAYLSIVLVMIFYACNQKTETISNKDVEQVKETKTNNVVKVNSDNGDIKPIYLTAAEFKKKIWDYEANPEEWIYKGDIPCVIDFYADWCKPCKMVAPIMDDLADYYDGKVIIYKVDTDKERELASVFQVNSIPSVLFSPLTGRPAMQPGAMAKEDYIRIIDEFVLKLKTENSKSI
jgi:thioredoxin